MTGERTSLPLQLHETDIWGLIGKREAELSTGLVGGDMSQDVRFKAGNWDGRESLVRFGKESGIGSCQFRDLLTGAIVLRLCSVRLELES